MVKPPHRFLTLVLPCFSLFLAAGTLVAAEFYVAPNGSPSGTGSFSSPWNLQTALNQPSSVHAGDTIWLRGGTYTGNFSSSLAGTSSSPIIVRQYAGERATLDGSTLTEPTLTVNGAYTWYWGFEVMSSSTDRVSGQAGSWPTDLSRGDGISSGAAASPGLKFINLTVHDARQGFSAFTNWSDTEIYGSLVYYNGWEGPDRGHGHGIYSQNQNGYKRFTDTLVFSEFDHNIHIYGSDASYLDNFTLQGNTTWNAGILSNLSEGRNLLLGGTVVAHNPTLKDNMMYRALGGPTSDFDLGYASGSGCSNATVTNNYVSNNTYFAGCLPVTMTGNTYYGGIVGFSKTAYPSNTYYSSRPTGLKVFVRPNQYEAGRANITVFNWSNAATASVDLTGILAPGTGFEIRNAQDFFGAPVLTGTYNGGSVSIPVTSLSVAAPIGWAAPAPTGPDFNVFVLLPAAPAGTPTPTPATTATRTPTRTPTGAATPTPTPGGGSLGPPWQQQDIGAVGLAGSGSNSGGPFAVGASGTDIEDTSDQFHYVYQSWNGDGTVIARVTSIQNSNPWAKGGVMIRETLAANSMQAMTVLTPGNGVSFQRRKTTGGTTTSTTVGGITAPYWVKIVRSGSTFTGYRSSNGTSWTLVGSDTITMAANVYVGLALTSHNNSVLCASSIDSVSVTSGNSSTVLRVEAESPVLTAPMAAVSDSTAFGGKYAVTTVANSGTGAWTFTAPVSGTYYIWCRIKTANPDQDSFFVKMDSGGEDIYDAAGGVWSGSWHWTRLNGRGGGGPLTINPRTFSLTAGTHTLTFRGREVQTKLDRVIITNDSTFVATEAP